MKRKWVLLCIIVCLVIGGGYFYFAYRQHQEKLALERKKAAWLALERDIRNEIKGFRGVAAVVIKDMHNDWQIDFNKDILTPSASLVKIPIMMAYFLRASEGKVNLKDEIKLNRRAKSGGSGILKNTAAGTIFSLNELMSLMITESDNTAANILIDLLGFDALNSDFSRLGLKNTNLSRKMMDFSQRKKGVENYTTAQDMAYLLENIYHHRFVNGFVSQKCIEILKRQKVKDRLPKKLPAGTVVAHKTGLEYGICHDVGIVFTKNGDFVISVLTRHNNKFAYLSKKFIADIALLVYNYYNDL